MRPARRGHSLPWLTPGLVAAGFAVSTWPGAASALEFRRDLVLDGEVWRLFTGQLVHWTGRMALFDLGTVLLLGCWLEIRSRPVVMAILVAAMAVIGGGTLLLTGVATYRGASGLASALFVGASLALFRRAPNAGSRAAAALFLLLFSGKTMWEVTTGQALAAGRLPAGVAVTPAVHLLGAAAGLLGWLMPAPPSTEWNSTVRYADSRGYGGPPSGER